MTVKGTICIPKSPAPWAIEHFQRFNFVEILTDYRRCNYRKDGWQCRNLVKKYNKGHAKCSRHEGMKGEEAQENLTALVASVVSEIGKADVNALCERISVEKQKVRTAASRAVNAGLIVRVDRGIYASLEARS